MNKLQKTFNDIVERTRAKPIGTAGSFSGLCPSHDDNSASMSITLENGFLPIHFFSREFCQKIVGSLFWKYFGEFIV